MNRYQKANEGIHAPDELKRKAAQPSQRGRYRSWMGTVAAVLAVAILGGAALWPRQPGNLDALSNSGGGLAPRSEPGASGYDEGIAPMSGDQTETFQAHALALAAYPEMAPYPRYEDYLADIPDDKDSSQKAYDAYSKAYRVWLDSVDALRSGTDYTGLMDDFLSVSTAQFLSNAGAENRIYSPLNVYMALSMLAETTGGNSRQQILDLLQVDSIEALRERVAALWKDNYRDDGIVTSILANSLWLRDGMTYSQEVLDTLAQDYYASSFSGEMGSEEYNQALRDWLNEQTRGLLSEQAEELEMDADTVLALASTIYFKSSWYNEFSKSLTEQDVFHAPGGDVETDFMHRTMSEGIYYWGEHFAAVQLSFQQGGSMWLILPDEGYTVDELLESGEAMEFLLSNKYGHLDEDTGKFGYYQYPSDYYEHSIDFDNPANLDESKAVWVDAWPGQEYLIINLSMPKFDVSSDLDLIGGLQALGVTDVFDWAASNFDPLDASTDDPLFVSAARHAARVTVDEEGCEAAAYTVMMNAGAGMPPDEEVDFVLDRPFLFAITGCDSLPLFIGVVNQPA